MMGNVIEKAYEDIPQGLKPCKTQVTQSTVKDNLEAYEMFKQQCRADKNKKIRRPRKTKKRLRKLISNPLLKQFMNTLLGNNWTKTITVMKGQSVGISRL